MRFPGFADLSLSGKLTFLFTLASAAGLLIFAVALWEYESNAYRRELLREMSTLSQTLADSSAAALTFRDDQSAAESLGVLHSEPRVDLACLYRVGGVLAAVYVGRGRPNCPAQPGPDRSEYGARNLTVAQTSRLRGEVAGKLLLVVDLGDLSRQLHQLGLLCFGALGTSLLFAALLASRLQRIISGPVLELAAVASRVSVLRDYSIRAPLRSGDEFGVLAGKFNEMMNQVYERDLALERARAELEDRVRSRTKELNRAQRICDASCPRRNICSA
jgi:HAMP domain-containing protein